VYEIETGKKRYSITTSAGAKIQPYFDVPAPNDSNLYYFRVQGEELEGGLIRVWITSTTALLMENLLGAFDTETISSTITRTAAQVSEIEKTSKEMPVTKLDVARPIHITTDAYQALTETFAGVSDEHMIQLFLRYISQ
jgi:hypothetical protein